MTYCEPANMHKQTSSLAWVHVVAKYYIMQNATDVIYFAGLQIQCHCNSRVALILWLATMLRIVSAVMIACEEINIVWMGFTLQGAST